MLSFIYSVVKSILRIYRVLGTEPNAENMVNRMHIILTPHVALRLTKGTIIK